jgi:threonine/homoserine/homoserine lactone efflux protein
MDTYLSTGIVLGLSAGFSPGPLTTLVISQSMQHGLREGLKVAMAPFITDLPIILISLLILAKLRNFNEVLGVISILGGFVLMYLAYLSFKTRRIEVDTANVQARSLSKGTLVNFFSPNPYLFWLTIGAPTVIAASERSYVTAAGFFAAFYACLIGGKFLMAFIAAKSRDLLTGVTYRIVMRVLGGILVIMALMLFRDGHLFFD